MKIVDTKVYLDMVCALLEEGSSAVQVPVAGSSMVPFLHHGDTVYLAKPDSELRRGDIVLYTRPSGQYVLHRIAKRCRDGSFLIVGDAQTELERVGSAAQIHARVTQALHRGRRMGPDSLRWPLFAIVWLWVRPWRRQIMVLVTKWKGKTR